MLTSDDFDILSNEASELYLEFEQGIINDIARRLAKMSFSSASWQVQRLSESGLLYDDILKRLAQLTGKSERTLREIFKKYGVKGLKFDDSIYIQAGKTPIPLNLNPAMLNVLEEGLRKTNSLLRNLTLTTAIGGQNAFIRATDIAYLEITNGSKDYNSAIKKAIKDIAAQGINTVDYLSGSQKLDVSVRRAILTGVGQTVGKLQLQRASEMQSDLVQTSAHIGARPSHAVWQGKVFSRSGTSKKYSPFVESTGYGTVTGLAGVNCRHSFYPFFEGISENAYSKEELKDFKKETVKFNGQDISVYEATQYQRGIERKIREWKRQAEALKAAKLEAPKELAKVKQWQSAMRSFIKQTGLQKQSVRETIVV